MTDNDFKKLLSDTKQQLLDTKDDVSQELSFDWFEKNQLTEVQQYLGERIIWSVDDILDPVHCDLCRQHYVDDLDAAIRMIDLWLAHKLTKLVTIYSVMYAAEDRQSSLSFVVMAADGQVKVVSALTEPAQYVEKWLVNHKDIQVTSQAFPYRIEGTDLLFQDITPLKIFYEEIKEYAREDIVPELMAAYK